MDKLNDDYYYRLGRLQAGIEQNDLIIQSEPIGVTFRQKRDWIQGYSEMASMLSWRRKPVELKEAS
jgi:hypothetical protein